MGCTNSSQSPSLESFRRLSTRKEIKEVNENDLPHVFKARYQTGKILGKGAFAVVRLARNKVTGQRCAVKIVDRASLKPDDEVGLRQEVDIMQSMNHPHIVRLLDFFEEEKIYYLVLELMEGGELFDRVVKKTHYNEKEARDVVKILVEAIRYCHDMDVVHRDLKPENLLLTSTQDDADLKIADFGFAIRDNKGGAHNMLATQCGTPAYIAPEILRKEPYGKSVDMWSIGVITYILLGGYPPFHDENLKNLFRKIRHCEFSFHPKYWDKVSDEAKDLIRGLLTVDVHQRLTAAQVLEHPWIKHDDATLQANVLGECLEEFKKFHASRKLKAAVRTVMMINRLNRMMGRSSISEPEIPDHHSNQPLNLTDEEEDGSSEKRPEEAVNLKDVYHGVYK